LISWVAVTTAPKEGIGVIVVAVGLVMSVVVGFATCSVCELVVEDLLSRVVDGSSSVFEASFKDDGDVTEDFVAAVSAAVIDGFVGPSRL
jgi:hypothetical protein